MNGYTGLFAIVAGIGFAALGGAVIGGIGTAAAGAVGRRKKRRASAVAPQDLFPMQIEKPRAPGLADRLLRRHAAPAPMLVLTDAQLAGIEAIARAAEENDRGHGASLTDEQVRLGINSEAVLLLVSEVRRARSRGDG